MSVDVGQQSRIREGLRQLSNMQATIDRHSLDFLPDTAADVLGMAAEAVDHETLPVSEYGDHTVDPDDQTGTPNGDDESEFEVDDDENAVSLISDYGFEMEPTTDVLDADGEFDYGETGDQYFAIGMFDVGLEQRKMNTLTKVSLTVARSMVKYGLAVIGQAIASADASELNKLATSGVFPGLALITPSNALPGKTARTNCQAHLQWHQNKLASMSGPPDSTMYDSVDDLKKWCMQAFIEGNAVEEGAQYLSDAWDAMWIEIAEGLKRITVQILKLPGQAVEAVTGIPWWLVYGGGAVVVGGLLYGAFKLITSESGSRIIGGYLGGRR